jgi:hypothetical protein
MLFLSRYFCVDIMAFAILSNHWHCVIRNRPDLVEQLSDREVVVRWLSVTGQTACRKKRGGEIRQAEIDVELNRPGRVAELRSRLSDVSWFVRLMCQTIAMRCNIEDECTGRFFEERFKLTRLEEDADVLACMAYVDLNPLRAGMVDSLDSPGAQVSIAERLRSLSDEPADPSSWLAPLKLASEVNGQPAEVVNRMSAEEVERRRAELAENLGCLPMTLAAYERLLWHLALESRPELQAKDDLTADQLREPTWADGQAVDIDLIRSQQKELARCCDATLRGHACRATKAATARTSNPRPPVKSTPHRPTVLG